MNARRFFLLVLAGAPGLPAVAQSAALSPEPTATTLTLYDTGMAAVSERRRVDLAGGDQEVRILALPALLRPESVALLPEAGGQEPFELASQAFLHDLRSPQQLLGRYVGHPIRIRDNALVREGILLGVPELPATPGGLSPIYLAGAGGEVTLYPQAQALQAVEFPGARTHAQLQPALVWQVRGASQGLANLRLSYQTGGLSWRSSYTLLFNPDGQSARLDARASFANRSGVDYKEARVRLVSSERGSLDPLFAPSADDRRPIGDAPPQRYLYGAEKPVLEKAIASLSGLSVHNVKEPLSIADGSEKTLTLASARHLPVRRFYVYDGVRFDRFQRNRRTDWSYGTESHAVVDGFVEFDNSARHGLGSDLPPGLLRVMQQMDDGSVDLLAETMLPLIPAGGMGSARLGPARELRGERERTSYAESRAKREFEESFEVRLYNRSAEDQEIRVVERLYRWPDFEIVKADLEYREQGAQAIEFRPTIKAGGTGTIRYTVRYRW